jgi:SAM-dependent methyltransferase
MREAGLRLLGCPCCRCELALISNGSTRHAPDGHIMTGTLVCVGCAVQFAIRGGIPRFVTADVAAAAALTSERFGAEWKIFDHMSSYQEQWLRNWLEPMGPADFAGRVVFEGGCGKGRHTIVVAGWGAHDIVALDLGDSVEVAFAHTRHLANVHVVQGDLVQPPVRDASFDVGFSVGVLHHLPSPRAGFDSLQRLVRSGGKLAIWVYGYESNEWIVRWVSPLRERVTARMPIRLLYWLTIPPAAALSAAAKLYRTAAGSRLPYCDYVRTLAPLPLREVHHIVFDQLVTPIAFYLPREEVQRWFESAGMTDAKIAWHNKNSWRGSGTVAMAQQAALEEPVAYRQR